MKFFKPPFTKENLEGQFKRLSKSLHPDKGGSKEDFQALVQEKETILQVITTLETVSPKIKRIRMRKRPKVILQRGIKVTEKDVDAAIKSLSEIFTYAKELKKLFK